ncbi:hypothetical protein [Runella sp.]|uniref:hypothetical protein n=1 Tax=Runella sp. TaxID=1960881 RepID=UPI003D0FC6BA
MAGKTLVFTICTAEQYPFAQVLADSLPKTIPFKIGIVGRSEIKDSRVVNFEQLPFAEIAQMQQHYDLNTLVAASKPFFADYFLKQEDINYVIYFDPTVLLFSDFEAIEQKVAIHDITLTPRLTRKFGKSLYGDEKMFLNTGMYDNGFFAVNKSQNTSRFLTWWQQRLTDRAYFDVCNGMNHDQLWLNYVPILFENICINKNIGWNVGLQNLHERVLTYKNKQWLVNQGAALAFFNFKEVLGDSPEVKKMIKEAGAEVLVNDYKARIKQYTSVVPTVFSLREALNPYSSALKQGLKKNLKSIVDTITYFPIYHKITK